MCMGVCVGSVSLGSSIIMQSLTHKDKPVTVAVLL